MDSSDTENQQEDFFLGSDPYSYFGSHFWASSCLYRETGMFKIIGTNETYECVVF